MTLQDFKRLYNPLTRCYIESKPDRESFTLSGLIIDVQGPINNNPKIYIDNWYNMIRISDIKTMHVSNSKWLKD